MSPFPNLVAVECERSARMYPPLANHDEAMSVLDEEVCEVQKEVHRKPGSRTDEHLLEELVQVAAVARRWAETTGIALTIGTQFERAVEITLALHRRELPKANSDHENMTRLKRIMARVWNYSVCHGHTLAACQHDVALALVVVAVTCRRWAEDRNLCPTTVFEQDVPASNGQVTVVTRPEPVTEPEVNSDGTTSSQEVVA